MASVEIDQTPDKVKIGENLAGFLHTFLKVLESTAGYFCNNHGPTTEMSTVYKY